MFNTKKIFGLLFSVFIFTEASSQQVQFSLATDLSILRSFKKEQRFWAIGQTVSAQFHFTPKEGAHVFFSYYTLGKFTNTLFAIAKSPGTTPSRVRYQNKAELSVKHISLGWKRYLKGVRDSETSFNLYGYAGFGLMLGSILNTHSTPVDTAAYVVPVLSGKANFKRLTLDLGLGIEFPIGGGCIYLHGRKSTCSYNRLSKSTSFCKQECSVHCCCQYRLKNSFSLINSNAPIHYTIDICQHRY